MFFCLTLLASAGATEIDTRGMGQCAAAFDVGRALLNETLHEQVFYWANDHEVREWQWEKTTASPEALVRWDLSAAEGAGLECVAIRYAAGIRLPEPFESLLVVWHMAVEIPLRVEKVVCRGNRVLYEDAMIREPVLDQIRMVTKHKLVTDFDLESSAKTTLSLPWYAQVLEGQVSAALDRSVGEKFDAVVRSLCEPVKAGLTAGSTRMRTKRRNMFPGWTGLKIPSNPFAGTARDRLANETADENGTHVHKPRRPHKPLNANETWVVFLLPDDEPWPAPLAPKEQVQPCPEDTPCEKPRLAVRRRSGGSSPKGRVVAHTSASTTREEAVGGASPSRGTTT
jgi:hypothetical protein